MHQSNSILIRAPKAQVFETTTDLEHWPNVLPHYRFIRFLDRRNGSAVVRMAASRSGIPISWVSEVQVDRENTEMRFEHLRAFTKGMRVVWRYTDTPDGVRVEIVHDLKFRVPFLRPIADLIIGRFFIEHVAGRTLRTFKKHLETKSS